MKILIVIVILSCQHKIVNSQFPDVLLSIIRNIANGISSEYQILQDNLKLTENHLFRPRVVKTFKTFTQMLYKGKKSPGHQSLQSESTTMISFTNPAAINGRILESHPVRTDDAYILTLHHLIAKNYTKTLNKSVLLHHGLLGSSADWTLLSEKSLPSLLSDAGYDVWMTNARGNQYSRAHESMDVDSSQFWDFSWQEMGQYDLPAIINYIRSSTNSNDTINYIGHSMGATALLVLLSTLPEYNKYIRVGILLAPLAFMTDIKGPLGSLAKYSEYPVHVMDTIGRDVFFPKGSVPDYLSNQFCNTSKLFCRNPLFFVSGVPREINNWNRSFVARLLYYVRAGGSTKTLLHYVQLIKSREFHNFDNESSVFPLSQITVPMAMFSSNGDSLATVPNVQKLYFSIGNPIEHIVLNNLTHTEFLWGSNVNTAVYTKVLELL